ncbi:phage tail protein [Aeromonas sp. ARM81]|nr:phage tail protein [Aeromonas sp. ARM81]
MDSGASGPTSFLGIPMTNEQRLEQAREAKHQLLMGKSAVQVGHGQRQVTFSQRTIAELDKYIQQLEVMCGQSNRRGPGRLGV